MKPLSLLLIGILSAQFSFAASELFPGTERTPIVTPADRQEILLYIQNTKRDIVEALKESKGKTSDVALKYLTDVVMKTTIKSGKRPDLLMRIILAQALELVNGIPDLKADPSGSTMKYEAALAGSKHVQLKVAMLRQALKLALKYYQSDVDAVLAGNLAHLPFGQLAIDRMGQVLRWWPAIFDTQASFKYISVSLNHIGQIIKRDDELKVPLGEFIIYKDGIEDLEATADKAMSLTSRSNRDAYMRQLRSKVYKLFAQKLKPTIARVKKLKPSW